ncbi:MAG TPA: histidine kinase dimerization/phospho-acceptor domain-containing protein, partial [Steroidobacteraceae bacterium]|nr:histidine kinase dimerization/phospho-acceptor domain-containing protein [Steroidobacteraceae bacterium]
MKRETGSTWWPSSLFGRIALILLVGVLAAYAASFTLVFYERSQSTLSMMLRYLSKDIASGVAVLERVAPAERPEWLAKLERRNYRYELTGAHASSVASSASPGNSALVNQVLASLRTELEGRYVLSPSIESGSSDFAIHLTLGDGTPLAIHLAPNGMPLPFWIWWMVGLQLVVLLGCAAWAVRLATRPLTDLAVAADRLRLEGSPAMEPHGPVEVQRAAIAFNAMQVRIQQHIAERIQMLAAISHDLQTPITRMRLRAELMEESKSALRAKLLGDLDSMQSLVEEGIAYARGRHAVNESERSVDVQALLESIVYDYTDAGRSIAFAGTIEQPILTRPVALKRIVINLIGKFQSVVDQIDDNPLEGD